MNLNRHTDVSQKKRGKKVYYKFYIRLCLIATGANILELQHHATIENECTSLDHTRRSLSFDSEIRLQSCFLMRRECHGFFLFSASFYGVWLLRSNERSVCPYDFMVKWTNLRVLTQEFMHTEPAPWYRSISTLCRNNFLLGWLLLDESIRFMCWKNSCHDHKKYH